MVMNSSASTSLKEYLKKYENNTEDEMKKKKKKKKAIAEVSGVLVVDEDPVWQKPVKLDEEEDNDSPDEKPQVDEDIEVKRMKRLEQLRSRRPYHGISEDGSGWVSISDAPKYSTSTDQNIDISPPRKRRTRNDTPSPEPEVLPSRTPQEGSELSPSRQRHRHHDSPLPKAKQNHSDFDRENSDLSPPRQQRRHNDSPSPDPISRPSDSGRKPVDLSPHRKLRKHCDNPSPEPERKPSIYSQDVDLSPPRKDQRWHDSRSPMPKHLHSDSRRGSTDLSPPRQRRGRYDSPSQELGTKLSHSIRQNLDISPPHCHHIKVADPKNFDVPDSADTSPPRRVDLSPPRKSKKGVERMGSRDFSLQHSRHHPSGNGAVHLSMAADLSPPRKIKEQPKTGLVTGQDIKEEIARTKEDDLLRFKGMDPSMSGRGAEPVYRDKIRGQRISKEEYFKSDKKEEKPKEKKLEWGKGLAQKREAEERLLELELEKEKPFARSRDDPELDKMLKERVRWGDPMAHLVKRKQPDLVLPDLGESEKMKESGFVIPQEIPSHSWIRRGLDAAPNRYGIKPGRHWDGVDRSNGYEKELFKRMNEKRATEREAYLWSASDM
ncbi:hypothetical protein Ancab_010010 [Ancistrocladus abbreviatus]